MNLRGEIRRVLALHPTGKGLGFAILEGPESLIDWGTKRAVKISNDSCLAHVAALIDQYHLDLVVVEDVNTKGCRRSARVRELVREIRSLARKKRVRTRALSRRAVREVFGLHNSVTKHRIAARIVERFPELASRLPPPRKSWMSEHYNMQIFDAVALGLTYFGNERRVSLA